MVSRSGHSLPELVVAVTFLATSLLAVGASTVLGARWTARAAARQEAVRLAGTVLDSMTAFPVSTEGDTTIDGFSIRWGTGPDGGTTVRVSAGNGGPVLAELEGYRLPVLPVLPDRDAAYTAPVGLGGGAP